MTATVRILLAAMACACIGHAAAAQTLADAIANAYRSNPSLQAARAQLRGVDEGYVQARAALGPSAAVQGVAGASQTWSGLQAPFKSNNGQAQLTVSQPLYSHGLLSADVDAAQAGIEAGRQGLRIAEGNVVLAVVQAYADVLRDQAALAVHQDNIAMLADEVKETHDRQQDGELTTTDVAQAEAQLANEHAQLLTAKAQLQISRAEYAVAVGEDPVGLSPAPVLPGLPASADRALDVADAESPELLQAKFNERVSAAKVRVARAANGPSVALGVTATYGGPLSPFQDIGEQGVLTGQVTVSQPLFTSGQTSSQIRQALDQNSSDRLSIEVSRRAQVQAIANAWNQMTAARENTAVQQEDVRANQAAFTGMRIEQRAGERATLDVLITQENLIAAELALLVAQHDDLVAQASLLRAMGRLEAAAMVPGLPQYNVAQNLRGAEHHVVIPWAGAVQALDQIGAPGTGQRSIPEPDKMRGPAELAAPNAEPPRDELLTHTPSTPIPGAP